MINSTQRGSSLKKISKNLLAVLIGCIIALILFEIILQFYNPIEIRVRGDHIILPAYKDYTFVNKNIPKLDDTIFHTKNSLGFRGPEIPSEGLDDYLSIITVGGSTTECFYLSDNKTWSALLGENLKEKFPKVWVNNAGLDGHSTFGHELLIKEHIIKLSPDFIILLVGANDVGNEGYTTQMLGHVKDGVHFDSIESFVKSVSLYSEVMALTLNFYKFMRAKSKGLAHNNLELENSKQVEYPESNLQEILLRHEVVFIPEYEERLRRIIQITKENNIEVIFITQPALFGRGIDNTTGVNLEGVETGGGLSGYTQWKILELYNNATEKVAEEEGVFYIDLANKLPKDSKYYYDFYHYTNEGAEEISSILSKDLNDYLITLRHK